MGIILEYLASPGGGIPYRPGIDNPEMVSAISQDSHLGSNVGGVGSYHSNNVAHASTTTRSLLYYIIFCLEKIRDMYYGTLLHEGVIYV